jgi:hypothetical protein
MLPIARAEQWTRQQKLGETHTVSHRVKRRVGQRRWRLLTLQPRGCSLLSRHGAQAACGAAAGSTRVCERSACACRAARCCTQRARTAAIRPDLEAAAAAAAALASGQRPGDCCLCFCALRSCCPHHGSTGAPARARAAALPVWRERVRARARVALSLSVLLPASGAGARRRRDTNGAAAEGSG